MGAQMKLSSIQNYNPKKMIFSVLYVLCLSSFAFGQEHEHEHEHEQHDSHSNNEHDNHVSHSDHENKNQTFISEKIASDAGIVTQQAGEKILYERIKLFGKTTTDPQQISHLRARFPGLIKKVNVSLGDKVKIGDVLIQVEANDSLQNYNIRSPINGIVIQRHANPGEVTDNNELLTIANYQQLWVEFDVFPSQFKLIRPLQEVKISSGDLSATSNIHYLTPLEGGGPTILARALLQNPSQLWTPQLMVEGLVSVNSFKVPIAVNNRALQTINDSKVVFIKEGDSYKSREVEIGRNDESFTEVVSGLDAGDHYVVENSYLIKADIEKSGASHDH